jgi:hypothetical protein
LYLVIFNTTGVESPGKRFTIDVTMDPEVIVMDLQTSGLFKNDC